MDILVNWLSYREQLRAIGFNRGFQWLDGSFLEAKDPKDLDFVTFFYRPIGTTVQQALAVMHANKHLFDRGDIKKHFTLDALFVDLQGSAETIVRAGSAKLNRAISGVSA
jgi:hypothetical protein